MENFYKKVAVVGGGLAGSEAALQLANRGISVDLFEMRPKKLTPVHKTDDFAELVCSNSFKSTKENSAAGMLKQELRSLHSHLFDVAQKTRVEAGGALAVDRDLFSQGVTQLINENSFINVINREIKEVRELGEYDAVILASGPMTSENLANSVFSNLGSHRLNFYDAAAPIVIADSLDYDVLFKQNRYEDADDNATGDYFNAPFTRDEYENFVDELLAANRVILKNFEKKELFSACQPIEEIARSGYNAPRFGPLKPVGLIDPRTNKRPWAVVQLRSENKNNTAYNLVGFQTNLTFPEQKRVFSMIPGLKNAEFARFGVMHKNVFIDSPRLLDKNLLCKTLSNVAHTPVYVAGQLSGTEGYMEAVRSGLHAAISVSCQLKGVMAPCLSDKTVFGSLLSYATDEETKDYQPMHVNFGIIAPLDTKIKNKQLRYSEYQSRGLTALNQYFEQLVDLGIM